MPAKTTNAPKRFELPALDFKFESLTTGTDIPPPLPSPVQETAPVLPAAVKPAAVKPAAVKPAAAAKPVAAAAAAAAAPAAPAAPKAVGSVASIFNGRGNGTISNSNSASTSTFASSSAPSASTITTTITSNGLGSKRQATDELPMTPTTAARHGPLRRLLSRSFVNYAYADDKASTTSLGSIARPDSRSNGSVSDEKKAKRRSGWFQRLRSSDTVSKRSSLIFDEPKKTGPPPPTIPELRTVETKIDLGNAGAISDESFFKSFK